MIQNVDKFCNGCGEKIPYDAKFCTKCGFKQIRIAEDSVYSLNESCHSNDDSNNKFEKIIQPEKSNSNIGIILLTGLVIVGFLFYFFFQNNKSNDNLLVAAADSVAVDTTSVYVDNIPVDTASSTVVIDSVPVVSNEATPPYGKESNSSNNFTGEEFARQKLVEISEAVNHDDYTKIYEIFEEPIVFHEISNATIPQIVKEVKNYKKRWQIVDENLISVSFILTDRRGMDIYEYEKTLQLERVPDNGKIYKYHIKGRVIINSYSGKINYLVDEETKKEN